MKRVYLDWNATAPLRPEARAAMIAAMDCLGNPSSVHAEGRAAKAIVEKARGQVADLVGCDRDEVVFTSGATEGAKLVLSSVSGSIFMSEIEHDCVHRAPREDAPVEFIPLDELGLIHDRTIPEMNVSKGDLICVQGANNETGATQNWFNAVMCAHITGAKVLMDFVQVFGKLSCQLNEIPIPDYALASAHKFGGPKGVGALIVKAGVDLPPSLGGGQEKGRRSGTENVVGIAGMGAAAEAAAKDLENGLWQIVEQNRNVFEARLLNEVPELIIFGSDVPRLPNTSYFAVPGWKAETQVMQMDLAGFAVSAGSACSSGKVKASRVLKAMGYDEITAGSAIRVSIGPSTTAAELESFADAWLKEYRRFKARQKGN